MLYTVSDGTTVLTVDSYGRHGAAGRFATLAEVGDDPVIITVAPVDDKDDGRQFQVWSQKTYYASRIGRTL
jgi:hypothetical protein